MKLISNLDVNGNKFINVSGANTLELVMPTVTGEGTITKTIATHDEIEAVIAKFAGAFQFMGDALRVEDKEGTANKTIVVTEGTTIDASSENRGNVYQLADGREFASDGTVWVELGFNIQKASASVDGLMSKEDYSKLSGMEAGAQVNKIEVVKVNNTSLTIDENKAVNIDLSAYDTTAAAQVREAAIVADLEEAEEVTSAALNDLNSRVGGLDSDIVTINTAVEGLDDRLTAAEGDITALKGSTVKSVAFGNGTAITPDANGKVTLTAAADGADGYMTKEDHTILSGIEEGAQVNIIEGVKLSDSSSALTPTNKIVTIPNATPGTDGTDGADGLMSSEDKFKLNGIAAGAEVNVQADWSVTDTTSDAYIANKPTNLAFTYLATYTTAQTNNTVTIAQDTHKCGTYPLVQVFAGNEVVSANVTVDTTDGGDVTVKWAGIDPTQTAIRIRIVGC